MGVRRYTTRLLVLVCLLGDLGGEGEGKGGYLHLGVGRVSLGEGVGPRIGGGGGVMWEEMG